MRKIRIIRVVVPEVVSYYGPADGTMEPDFQCSCGMGVAEEYKCCPYCGSELAWDKIQKPSKKFLKLLEQL